MIILNVHKISELNLIQIKVYLMLLIHQFINKHMLIKYNSQHKLMQLHNYEQES